MSLTQQYALDVHRLARQQQPPPPAPGTYEARLLADVYRRLRRALGRRSGRGPDSAGTPLRADSQDGPRPSRGSGPGRPAGTPR